jgi:hypothetical protein
MRRKIAAFACPGTVLPAVLREKCLQQPFVYTVCFK